MAASPLTDLPAVGEIEVDAAGVDVHDGEDQQVGAHAEVGKGEVAHEELRHSEIEHIAKQHEKHGQVANHRRDHDEPHADTQPREAHDIFAGVQCVGFWPAFDMDRTAKRMRILPYMGPHRDVNGELKEHGLFRMRMHTIQVNGDCHNKVIKLK